MRTRASVEVKWRYKIEEMIKKTELKYTILLQNRKKVIEQWWEHEIEKYERKKNSEIKKKEEAYTRKMMNEIREIEWKPKRVYKTDWPKIKPLQFALDIAQENAKLRDTDADGNWECISHANNHIFSWGELAWGHRYSRRFQHICLELENINAQCHGCNWATGPKGNTVEKEKVNHQYDENLDKKYGEWTADKLKKKLTDSLRGKWKKYDLNKKIPELIEENERLWATKNFYAPKKKWRKIWEEYAKRH